MTSTGGAGPLPPAWDCSNAPCWSKLGNMIGISLSRPFWVLAWVVLVLGMYFDYLPSLNRILSAPVFRPLSALTFGAYLTHPAIIKLIAANEQPRRHQAQEEAREPRIRPEVDIARIHPKSAADSVVVDAEVCSRLHGNGHRGDGNQGRETHPAGRDSLQTLIKIMPKIAKLVSMDKYQNQPMHLPFQLHQGYQSLMNKNRLHHPTPWQES